MGFAVWKLVNGAFRGFIVTVNFYGFLMELFVGCDEVAFGIPNDLNVGDLNGS